MKYSRQQLLEAINYWQARLAEMDESNRGNYSYGYEDPDIQYKASINDVVRMLEQYGIEVDYQMRDDIADMASGYRPAREIADWFIELHARKNHFAKLPNDEPTDRFTRCFICNHPLDKSIRRSKPKMQKLSQEFEKFAKSNRLKDARKSKCWNEILTLLKAA